MHRNDYERESSGDVEKRDLQYYKKLNLHRKLMVGLAGGLVVIVGALASFFYAYYDETEGRLAQLNGQLEAAQQQIAGLSEEKEELLAEADMVTVMTQDGVQTRMKKIPFAYDLEDWRYLLVNELNPLAQSFEPQLVQTRNSQRVDKRIRTELEKMIDDARAEGMRLMICSSYRDYEKQDTLMDESIAKYIRGGLDYRDAFFKTKEQIALTGASEHHTGLAVDIVGTRHQSLDSAQANTKEAKWLNEHAHEYGFILRYPADKEEITMISFESWHYRYVGKEAAAFMKENNLCLEEFVELAKAQKKQEADME